MLGAEQAGTTPELRPYSGQVTSTIPCDKYYLMSSSAADLWDKPEWSPERLSI